MLPHWILKHVYGYEGDENTTLFLDLHTAIRAVRCALKNGLITRRTRTRITRKLTLPYVIGAIGQSSVIVIYQVRNGHIVTAFPIL